MQTLTYGLKLPETGDSGSLVFPAMEANITRLDAHDHDGTDSPTLSPAASHVVTQSIASGSWVATSNGNYSQTVTLPGVLQYDRIHITIKLTSGHQVFPKIEKASSTTYVVYTNDSSVGFTAVYSS